MKNKHKNSNLVHEASGSEVICNYLNEIEPIYLKQKYGMFQII